MNDSDENTNESETVNEGSNRTFIFTGCDKIKEKAVTRKSNNIALIYDIVQHYSSKALEKAHCKSLNDFDFEVKTRKSHSGAVIIEDNNYIWSVMEI